MIPIYICDDEDRVREGIRQEVERQVMLGDYDMKVVLSTADPHKLLAAQYERACRGIYFLDVDLQREDMDGFRLGQELRRQDPRGFLAYITAYEDLAYQTFRYHLEAMDYIVKGDSLKLAESIRTCLRTVARRIQEEQGGSAGGSRFFTVRTLDCTRHIPLNEIICFETAPGTHRILLHGEHDRISFTGKLSEIEKEVGAGFVRSHRSFLVNREKIREINRKKGELVMEGGMVCLLSRAARGVL